MSSKLLVSMDYGQSRRKRTEPFGTVVNRAGEYMEFNSPMHVLNFFFEYNYDLVKAYSDPGNANTMYTYLLRKIYYVDD